MSALTLLLPGVVSEHCISAHGDTVITFVLCDLELLFGFCDLECHTC